MSQYIVKEGHALSSAKGIIGPPVDPENPTPKEIVTIKNFKNGKKGLTALLQHKKCPIVVFLETKKEKEEMEEKIEKGKVGQVTDKKSQQSEKNDNKIGAVKK